MVYLKLRSMVVISAWFSFTIGVIGITVVKSETIQWELLVLCVWFFVHFAYDPFFGKGLWQA